jgi:hypothetical protein
MAMYINDDQAFNIENRIEKNKIQGLVTRGS